MTPALKGYLLLSTIKMVVVFTIIMIGVALLTLMERKVSAWMQNRHGPNRVGWAGLLQPAADGVKNILKEETLPALANPWLFTVAPAFSFIPALLLSAVIPFAAPLPIDSSDFGRDIGAAIARLLPLVGPPLGNAFTWMFHAIFGIMAYHGPMPMVVADLPVGILFVLAISSLGVYGIALAGWSSNSKYALLGGLRASAQMVSYEVAMGLSLIPVLLMSGDVSFSAIVAKQQAGTWYVMPLFLSFFIFTIAGFAETNRLPFDLPEAESELITGYHTEYSAMKFSFFFIAEYANVVTVCAMITTLFFGGWDIPLTDWDRSGGLLPTLATWLIFFVKVLFWIFVVMWIRWTLPRFRYDQLMALGWKVMMPLALAYIMVMCTAIYLVEQVLGVSSPVMGSLILFALNLGIAILVFGVLDSGAFIRGSGYRQQVLPARGTRDARTTVAG
jgi:NADH-quinone oxidoreductase subunit H